MAVKLRTSRDSEGTRGVAIWCVPCGHAHRVPITGPNAWEWNGNREYPTLTPSLLVTRPGNSTYRCHSVVTDGNIAYCADSLHALAGKTVPLEDFPVYYGGAWDDAHEEKKMRFELRPPFVFFHDDKPGQHATLFATHERFGKGVVRYPFRGDLSSFDDATSQYAWAFEAQNIGEHVRGELLVFATADREIVGRVEVDGNITILAVHPLGLSVYRFSDKPITLR